MKRISAFAFIVTIIIITFVSCVKNPNIIKAGKTIKIGFLGPMSGDRGNAGKVVTQAIKIAVDEFNASGGYNGFTAELVIEDTKIDVKRGIRAMNKLAHDDMVVGIVGAWSSTVSLAVAPIAEENKIVMISPASSHKDLPDKGEFIFRTISSDALQAVVFARYLAEVEKIKRVGILHLQNDYSRTLAQDFKAECEKKGGKLIIIETGKEGDQDFIQQLKRIKANKPEAVYLPTFTVETALILEQMDQIGFKTKIYSSSTFANPRIFDIAGDLANGVIFTQMAEEPSGKSRKNFESKYHERWGRKPGARSFDDVQEFYDGTIYWGAKPDAYSLRAYDAAKIILNAIKASAVKDTGGNLVIDRDKLRETVAKTRDYNGASGRITFTPNGDLESDIGIFITRNRKYEQLKVYKIAGERLVRVK